MLWQLWTILNERKIVAVWMFVSQGFVTISTKKIISLR